MSREKIIIALIVCISLVVISCSPAISLFNQQAYEYAITLKVESLALMAKADTPYNDHAQEVETLIRKLDIAYEYARGRPKNTLSTQQWEILKDPERSLLGGFLKRWQKESTLNKAFINEAVELVGDAFDTIIGLESGKIKRQNAE